MSAFDVVDGARSRAWNVLGGTFTPGTPGGRGTFSITGGLNFNAGSFYAVHVAPPIGNFPTVGLGES